jgi:hypothetical protein
MDMAATLVDLVDAFAELYQQTGDCHRQNTAVSGGAAPSDLLQLMFDACQASVDVMFRLGEEPYVGTEANNHPTIARFVQLMKLYSGLVVDVQKRPDFTRELIDTVDVYRRHCAGRVARLERMIQEQDKNREFVRAEVGRQLASATC